MSRGRHEGTAARRHEATAGASLVLLGPILLIAGCTAGGGEGLDPEVSYEAQVGFEIAFGEMPPPSDGRTVVLFDGTGWDQWVERDGDASAWAVQRDGSVQVGEGDAVSRRRFGDHQIHLEFFLPEMAGKEGQARANSGVYVHGRYEVQVLDSWGREPDMGSCGAIYSLAPPLVNASRPPGTWQSYDIIFRAPRYGPVDELLAPARMTVLHNGVCIHNNVELPHPTPGGLRDLSPTMGPLMLQDHDDPVRYRNVWVRPLD